MEIVNEKVSITTGDSKNYELPYELSAFDEDFHYTKFDFLNTPGSLIDRKEIQATRYDLTVYFTGADHLIDANEFRNSTLDKRPWLVEHPFNGTRNMQPLTIKYNNTNILHTAVTISLSETIMNNGLLIAQDPKSLIESGAENLNDDNNEISSELIQESNSEVATLTDTANGINSDLRSKISSQEIADKYSDIFFKLNSSVGSFGSDAIQTMRQITNMLLMPRQFIDNIKDRLDFVKSQFDSFLNLTQSSSTIYTAQYFGASVISAYTVTAVPSTTVKYNTASEVDEVALDLWGMFTDYASGLQSQQTVNGFVPNYDIASQLYEQVVNTIFNLYQIALDLPTVVEDTVKADTMAVILSHTYGMDFDLMFKVNNWSIAQTLIIPKDSPFKYYI